MLGCCLARVSSLGDAMATEADRRRDLALRQAIDEYRQMAAEAREDAAKSKEESVRSQYPLWQLIPSFCPQRLLA